MRSLIIYAAAALALAGCGPASSTRPNVENVWARLPAAAGVPGAAYFTLRGGPKQTELVGITSGQIKRIELHESMSNGKMTGMRPLPSVGLPAGAKIEFRPAGRHAMLFGISPEVLPLSTLKLRFRFADGTTVEREAPAMGAGDPEPQFLTAPKAAGPVPCKSGMKRVGDRIVITNCAD